MTRKHFEAIAVEFLNTKPSRKGKAYDLWSTLAVNMSNQFNYFNLNFDSRRFLSACGLTYNAKFGCWD
jgi:hypothetical protein